MSVSRRGFLAGAATLALAGASDMRAAAANAAATNAVSPDSAAPEPPALRATRAAVRLAPPDYPETPIWGYDGRVPGPVLRVAQGGRLIRRFVNELPQPSTIHWHGIRIANPMDGVPDLTQAPVPPGGDFLYDFVAPDAGTWWYHPHHRSWEQVARGLYGALIVEEPAPARVDRDEVLLIDDWRLTGDAGIHESFGAMMDLSHAGPHRQLGDGQRRRGAPAAGEAAREVASAAGQHREREDLQPRACGDGGLDHRARRPAPRHPCADTGAGRPDRPRSGAACRSGRGRHHRGRRAGVDRFVRARARPHHRHAGGRWLGPPGEAAGAGGAAAQSRSSARAPRGCAGGGAAHGRRGPWAGCAKRCWTGGGWRSASW